MRASCTSYIPPPSLPSSAVHIQGGVILDIRPGLPEPPPWILSGRHHPHRWDSGRVLAPEDVVGLPYQPEGEQEVARRAAAAGAARACELLRHHSRGADRAEVFKGY